MTIADYIKKLNTQFKTGNASEHTYRGDLQLLLSDINKKVLVTNEPKRIDCGAPDYIITKNNIPIGYIEAKDIGSNLTDKKYKEQFDRYKKSLDNLIITDYLTFELYINGGFVQRISIGEIQGNKIAAKPENDGAFIDLINGFTLYQGQTIKTSQKLAQMMASKARILEGIIEKAVKDDTDQNKESDIRNQMLAFDKILIKGIKPAEFADIYSQTIAYGMFVARLHDESGEDFTRKEAANLIPKSNPFLRQLFMHIAGYDLDSRIDWVIDALADVFKFTDTDAILKEFEKSNQDPIIHFYETFLAEYNPALRKSRGVYYTPDPVVKFIVNAVDDILKEDFGITNGLADTAKTKIKVKQNEELVEKEVHKVQILDPACGTGTFLAEVISKIHKAFEGQQGNWSGYVEKELIPRLNGFELLMASYAMAHLKLDITLNTTGYKATEETQDRLKVYLTNSLEKEHGNFDEYFANWLSREANEANAIKRDTPVMVVIGNPPYSVSSMNKSDWIQDLIADYKKGLNERKINLDDDYIKFIRFGQYFIDKNGEGILAYICNNSFIDGITHRQMRKNLLESFDKIYILDLHGNLRKKESCPDGSADQNVFDIMQGVSINLFVKTGKKGIDELGEIFHSDLWGKREYKYETLNESLLCSLQWKKLEYISPNLFFTPKNFYEIKKYECGFKVDVLFNNYNSGVESGKDEFIIKRDEAEFLLLENDIKNLEANVLSNKFNITIDKVNQVLADINNSEKTKILYRPFDIRYTFLSKNSEGVFWRPRFSTMQHFLKENIGLIVSRINRQISTGYMFVSKNISDRHILDNAGDSTSVFPLYTYTQDSGNLFSGELIRTPNLNVEIVKDIEEKLGLRFKDVGEINPPDPLLQGGIRTLAGNSQKSPLAKGDLEGLMETFSPINLLDYIYAVLHSPKYRETYKEFLKIDFPRVPYPDNKEKFWKLVELGSYLRKIHLLEHSVVKQYITKYPSAGSNQVDKIEYNNGKVWINSAQYFEDVPKNAWEFYIGGYQPAQKWLKDRKGRVLSYEDINHYQEMIVALAETDSAMMRIDEVV